MTELKLLKTLSFKLQNHVLVDSVRFFLRSYFTVRKKLIVNFDARYLANERK